jgi:hypothetical protein
MLFYLSGLLFIAMAMRVHLRASDLMRFGAMNQGMFEMLLR